MTAKDLAHLHRACFTVPRPFTEGEIAGFLADPQIVACQNLQGFGLARVVLDEAEILTLAVDPGARRHGVGRGLMMDLITACQRRGARRMFLEVAAPNAPARALYQSLGFAESGIRRGYYRPPEGARIDAVLMEKHL